MNFLSKTLSRILLLIFFSCCFTNLVNAQESFNNLVKVTPLKLIFSRFEINYERKINNRFSVGVSVLPWFKNQQISGLGPDGKDTNKGTRWMLESKVYASKNQFKWNPFLGLAIFSGRHKITSERDACSGFLCGQYLGSARKGEIDLVSSGAALNLGVRRILKENWVIELGVIFGQSVVNKSKDGLVLVPTDSQSSEVIKSFDKVIHGQFTEPRLSIGYSF